MLDDFITNFSWEELEDEDWSVWEEFEVENWSIENSENDYLTKEEN